LRLRGFRAGKGFFYDDWRKMVDRSAEGARRFFRESAGRDNKDLWTGWDRARNLFPARRGRGAAPMRDVGPCRQPWQIMQADRSHPDGPRRQDAQARPSLGEKNGGQAGLTLWYSAGQPIWALRGLREIEPKRPERVEKDYRRRFSSNAGILIEFSFGHAKVEGMAASHVRRICQRLKRASRLRPAISVWPDPNRRPARFVGDPVLYAGHEEIVADGSLGSAIKGHCRKCRISRGSRSRSVPTDGGDHLTARRDRKAG